MPKKFAGENTKAAAARARKNAAKEEEQTRKEREKEDELWRDDDKHINRKLQRKVCKTHDSCCLSSIYKHLKNTRIIDDHVHWNNH